MDAKERTAYRRRVIGFVWQQSAKNLLPYLTAAENVELPMLLEGVAPGDRQARATQLLELVGLGERGDHRPDRLSGGEQQRVSIAVAIANRPAVLFADEPTGELDSDTAQQIFDLLRSVNAGAWRDDRGRHPRSAGQRARQPHIIRDGRTASETLRRAAVSAAGEHHLVAEEYAVLDRVGRLQLPRDYVDALGLQRRVRLVLEDDHITVWPDRDGDDGLGGAR